MTQKPNESIPTSISSDKEIIKNILLEKESDAVAKDRLYRILYEASLADDINMDTDLINECVKAIDLIEGNEEYLPEEKIKAMRQNVDQGYRNWQKSQRKSLTRKWVLQIAVSFVFILIMSSVVANAFGLNLLQLAARWGSDTFNLSTQNQKKVIQNAADRKTYSNIDDVFEGISTKPLLPGWLPDGFTFKYAEKFTRSDSTDILLYYEDSVNKAIVFDFNVYNADQKAITDTDYEKDDALVDIYEKSNVKHYILKNLEQVQAVWSNLNIVYNISGDLSESETKKIIDSMYGG